MKRGAAHLQGESRFTSVAIEDFGFEDFGFDCTFVRHGFPSMKIRYENSGMARLFRFAEGGGVKGRSHAQKRAKADKCRGHNKAQLWFSMFKSCASGKALNVRFEMLTNVVATIRRSRFAQSVAPKKEKASATPGGKGRHWLEFHKPGKLPGKFPA